jgi:hypothetical protein
MEWYESLAKPDWTPAPATIGLIWQILYPMDDLPERKAIVHRFTDCENFGLQHGFPHTRRCSMASL